MKKSFLLLTIALLFFSCKKDDNTSKTETIKKGEKWGIRIGSAPADVYARLQQLGAEKKFEDVAIVHQQSFSNVEALKNKLAYYGAVTLQKNTEPVDRIVIRYTADKVTDVSAGGALPNSISKWPQHMADNLTISINMPVSELYNRLQTILQMAAYQNSYKLILPDKPLNKPFDPDMINYNEWAFDFTIDKGTAGIQGRSSVRLYFNEGKLNKIQHGYDEYQVFN